MKLSLSFYVSLHTYNNVGVIKFRKHVKEVTRAVRYPLRGDIILNNIIMSWAKWKHIHTLKDASYYLNICILSDVLLKYGYSPMPFLLACIATLPPVI